MEDNNNINNQNSTESNPSDSAYHYGSRKNRRNRTRIDSQSSEKNDSVASCGVVDDVSSFTEKLSGGNLNAKSEEKNPEQTHRNEESYEKSIPSQEREGPSFETSNFKKRAREITLSDKSSFMKNNSSEKSDGAISYTTTEVPKVGIISKIKGFLKNLFSKNKSKKNHRKDWKNNKNNRKPFNKFDRNDSNGGKKYFHKHGNKNFKNRNFKDNRRHDNRNNQPTKSI